MPGNPHPWRIMTLIFCAVLLCAIGLQHLVSPAGDALVRAVDGRPVTLTGTIAAQPAGGRLVFRASDTTYRLSNPAMARYYAGRVVRITGTLHRATGLLEIRTIGPALPV
jgi:Protein of unknown function (DUF5818)